VANVIDQHQTATAAKQFVVPFFQARYDVRPGGKRAGIIYSRLRFSYWLQRVSIGDLGLVILSSEKLVSGELEGDACGLEMFRPLYVKGRFVELRFHLADAPQLNALNQPALGPSDMRKPEDDSASSSRVLDHLWTRLSDSFEVDVLSCFPAAEPTMSLAQARTTWSQVPPSAKPDADRLLRRIVYREMAEALGLS
jgi:hypothetical protein